MFILKSNEKMLENLPKTIYTNPDFDPEFSKRMTKLRKSKQKLDFKIINKNWRPIHVHKEVLTKRGSFLQNKCLKQGANSITMDYDVDKCAFMEFIEYLYTGTIELSKSKVFDICLLASCMKLDNLTTFCQTYIKKAICDKTCHLIYKFAEHNSQLTELFNEVESYVLMRFEYLISTDSMLTWSFKQIHNIITSNQLQLSNESQVILFVCKWLEFDFKKRKQHIEPLLDAIRFFYLTSDTVNEVVSEMDMRVADVVLRGSISRLEVAKFEPPRLYYKGAYLLGFQDLRVKFEHCSLALNQATLLSQPQLCPGKAAMVGLGRKIYLSGGEAVGEILSKVQVYDPHTDEWSFVSPMNKKRSEHGSCTFDDHMYVFGGYSDNFDGLASEVYYPDEDRWESFGPILKGMTSATRVEDSIYILIGTGEISVASIKVYKPHTNEWSDLPLCQQLSNLYEPYCMCGYGTKLFVFKTCRNMIIYDIDTNVCGKYIPPSKLARGCFGAIVAEIQHDQLYIFYTKRGIDIESNQYKKIVMSLDISRLGTDDGVKKGKVVNVSNLLGFAEELTYCAFL